MRHLLGRSTGWGGKALRRCRARSDRSHNWRELDPRRIEGPIPVECRSASCGTCWVGVLGGAEKLSDVAARDQIARITGVSLIRGALKDQFRWSAVRLHAAPAG